MPPSRRLLPLHAQLSGRLAPGCPHDSGLPQGAAAASFQARRCGILLAVTGMLRSGGRLAGNPRSRDAAQKSGRTAAMGLRPAATVISGAARRVVTIGIGALR